MTAQMAVPHGSWWNGAVADVVEGCPQLQPTWWIYPRCSFFAYHFIDRFNRLDQRPWSIPFSVKKLVTLVAIPRSNTSRFDGLFSITPSSYCFALTLRYPSFGFIFVYPYPSQWFIVTWYFILYCVMCIIESQRFLNTFDAADLDSENDPAGDQGS